MQSRRPGRPNPGGPGACLFDTARRGESACGRQRQKADSLRPFSARVHSLMTQTPPRPESGARFVLFDAPGFPTVDAPPIPRAVLDDALAGFPVERATSPGSLSEQL